MNKAKRIFITVLAAAMIIAAVPFSSTAAYGNVQQIFDFLVDEMGLNSAAACGVLANIECESEFEYTLYGDSGSSYGICQWHAERLTNMKNYCSRNNLDWRSLEGQLRFLNYELNTNKSDTGYIIDKLKNVPDTAAGAYDAGYDWCYYFERPANKSVKSENRGAMARDQYWPKYHRAAVSYGDINNDGKVNSNDALLAIQYSVGVVSLNDTQKKAADVDRNGIVNSTDALIILNVSIGSDSVKNYA